MCPWVWMKDGRHPHLQDKGWPASRGKGVGYSEDPGTSFSVLFLHGLLVQELQCPFPATLRPKPTLREGSGKGIPTEMYIIEVQGYILWG